ncbi:hypothetical protein DYQ05_01405 [Treponema pedis]|nr:hypothetical protein DYQ05_01405 [Treponema pedis]
MFYPPPPPCQNGTVYKLTENILYSYFFIFDNKRIRQVLYFVLCVFLYIYRLASKSRLLFCNTAGRISLGFYGQPLRNDRRVLFSKSRLERNPFDYWLSGKIERYKCNEKNIAKRKVKNET